jgi:acyl-CoA synthetase (AMP-forming)/AMP-acid ligase II
MTVPDNSVTIPTSGRRDSVQEIRVHTSGNPTARHLGSIVDILSARCSSEAMAYVFLENGTSDSEIRWTFADTARNSRAFAAHLRDRGIGTGDRVVLAVNPGLEYIAALYGIMHLGAIPVPCFPPLRAKELDRFHAITVDCEPAGIVISEMYREPMGALQRRLKSSGFEPVIVYSEHAADSADEVDPVSRAANDIALIQYTSGSTGSPKGVCLTHDNLMSNCEALGRSMGHDPRRIGLSWLPPYHDMGLMGTIMLSLYHGWPLVMMSPMHFIQSPLRWLRAITDYRVTITVGPNFSLDLCSDALNDKDITDTADLDLSTVKELYCGAEPISADTLARFEQITAPLGFNSKALIPCYGMAEATLFVAGKPRGTTYRTDSSPEPSATGRAVVSCGEVDSEHPARIVDTKTHKSLDDGLVGEIWVSGRSVAAGYHNRNQLTREVFHARLADEDGEYLRTGDLGFIRSGELFVTGRIKDLIIVNGRNIYPQDVETAITRANPGFRIAAAFSIPGNHSEQLCVVAEVGHREVSAELYSEMVEAIRFHVTSEFGIRPHVHVGPKRTIPTTTSGKVRRRETRRMFLADELRSLQIDPFAAQECTA